MPTVARCRWCGTENPTTFNYCGNCGRRLEEASSAVVPAASGAVLTGSGWAAAERRQLTVMFCDLVGSTALSFALDPEDLREVIRQYQQACAVVVERYDGYIAQYLGDGILVYFGYPTTHEDEPLRAVRAGLEVLRAIEGLGRRVRQEKGVDLAVRIGVHTGLVVVGEVGGGAHREQLAMGETPNLAARLQSVADPNQLVVSAATYRLVAQEFECLSLGPKRLKGIGREELAYCVVAERDSYDVFDLVSPGSPLPLIGREEEIAHLMARWEQVREGHGQVVSICGDAGIGKSHLIRAFKRRLDGTPHTFLASRCSPYHESSAFYPLVDLLHRMLNFYPEQPPEEQLDMIVFMLEQNGISDDDAAPLLARLLGVPLLDRFAAPAYGASVQRKHTQILLWRLLENLAGDVPLVLVVEDLQWVDPSSRALFERFVSRAAALPVFVLFTHRPGFQPGWAAHPALSTITLERLTPEEIERVVSEVAHGKQLPPSVLREIVRKTDGVPLFVQELTKMILEAGFLEEHGDHYALDGGLPALAIPATLQDSLMARLDRLSAVKEVAQIGSVLGRTFSYALLEAVASIPPATLQSALAQLTEADVLCQQGPFPRATYMFKHALIQDAAYESLLKRQRQALHRRVAERLEAVFPEQARSEPEVVAHHYARAGLPELTAVYLDRAGRAALEQSALQEAKAHFERGLALLEKEAETPERLRLRLSLLTGLGSALLPVRGYVHPEVRAAFEEARALSSRVAGAPEQLPALHGLWAHHQVLGDLEAAGKLAAELLLLVEDSEDEMQVFEVKRALGSTHFWRGELQEAYEVLSQAAAVHQALQQHPPSVHFSEHPAVTCGAYLSLVQWHLGCPEQALASADRAVACARALGHSHSEVFALGFRIVLHACLRDREAVRAEAAECRVLAERYGFPFWHGAAGILLAWTRIEEDPEAGIQGMQEGLAAFRAGGVRLWVQQPMYLLAEALDGQGRSEEGLALLEEAISMAQATGERVHLPELYRVQGELLLGSGPDLRTRAEASLEQALALARQQGARSTEVRSLESRVWNLESEVWSPKSEVRSRAVRP